MKHPLVSPRTDVQTRHGNSRRPVLGVETDIYLDEGLIRMGLEGGGIDSRLPWDTRSGDRLRAAPPDFPFVLLSYDLTKSRVRYANS